MSAASSGPISAASGPAFLPHIRAVLRLEEAAAITLAVVAYAQLGQPWWLFLAFVLAPDISILGYLGGPRAGARVYNLVHTYALPLLLGAAGLLLAHPPMMAAASIWAAHIALDRMLGFGLKLPTGFKDT